MNQTGALTLGVVADTHVPDRRKRLNPEILSIFENAGVQAILHAGDLSTQRVLDSLNEIAPTYAVRGNRDLFGKMILLPYSRLLTFGEVTVALTHGHGGWASYLRDKVHHAVKGLKPDRYVQRVLAAFPQADAIIFGHIHTRVNRLVDGRLLFNPGSACCPQTKDIAPSVGLLYIQGRGRITGEIIDLSSG